METKKNKISLKDLLNEKGLQLLNEAIEKNHNIPDGIENEKLNINRSKCPQCDKRFGYAVIGGKCYCFQILQ
jgi:hypothetical protein